MQSPAILNEQIDNCIGRMHKLSPKLVATAKSAGASKGQYEAKKAKLVIGVTDPKMPVSLKEHHANAALGSLIEEYREDEALLTALLKVASMQIQELSALQTKVSVLKKEMEQLQFGEGDWDA